MRKYIIFCFVLFSLALNTKNVIAQTEAGQIAICAGVGYSPGFNSENAVIYPVGINYNALNEAYNFSNIFPNLGVTVDYGLSKRFSIGLASSYQSEVVTYFYSNLVFDKITRINLTTRILFHLNKNHPHFDHYIGIRGGFNYWGDTPSPNPGYPPSYFLTNPNQFVLSFQVLYGMRIYLSNLIGIHFEVGIGEPYLAETGLSFRINTRKTEVKNDSVTPMGE